MRMSHGFETIAEGAVGTPYGHVPGHHYHDVIVAVGQRGQQYRAVALEVWGSCQGRDEEHGRVKVIARNTDARAALREVLRRAQDTMQDAEAKQFLPQAASVCEDELEDALEQ